MTTMVRMPVELKEKLEEMKDTYGKKTIYDMVEHLIKTVENQKHAISELQKAKNEEQQRREKEDIYLGEEMRKQLHEFQQSIKLRNPAHAVEFLLSNYDGSLDMNRHAFETYIRLRG